MPWSGSAGGARTPRPEDGLVLPFSGCECSSVSWLGKESQGRPPQCSRSLKGAPVEKAAIPTLGSLSGFAFHHQKPEGFAFIKTLVLFLSAVHFSKSLRDLGP